MEIKHPKLSSLEIEYLTLQKILGQDYSLLSLSNCSSCGHAHHHGHHHGHDHSNEAQASHEKQALNLPKETPINAWLKVVYEVGSLHGENLNSPRTKQNDLHFLGQEGGTPTHAEEWSQRVLSLAEKQIEIQLDALEKNPIPIEDLRADFGQSPLFKLKKLKSAFLSSNRKQIKDFLMGGVKRAMGWPYKMVSEPARVKRFLAESVNLVVRSGKYLFWNGLAQPIVQTFQTPRGTLRPLVARSRISSSERGRLSSVAIATLGGGMFFIYEFIMHGILHIHVACNHSLQFALAMGSAGVIHDVVRQPFLTTQLLPHHFSLMERAQLGVSISLARWKMGRLKKNLTVHGQGQSVETSHKQFMEKVGHQWTAKDPLIELYLNSPLWAQTAQSILNSMYDSRGLDNTALGSQTHKDGLFIKEMKKLFSPDLSSEDKRLLVSETLTGLNLYTQSMQELLIQMSHLTRIQKSNLKSTQVALGRIKKNILLMEELLLILSIASVEKVQDIFKSPEIVAKELKTLLDDLHAIRDIILRLNRESIASAQLDSAPTTDSINPVSTPSSKKPTRLEKAILLDPFPHIMFSSRDSTKTGENTHKNLIVENPPGSSESTKLGEAIRSLLHHTKENTLRLRRARRTGFSGGESRDCSQLLSPHQ